MGKRDAHTATVERRDSTSSDGSGWLDVYDEETPVRGLFEPVASQETVAPDPAKTTQYQAKFTWFGSENIKVGDRITWVEAERIFEAGKLTVDRYRVGSRVKGYSTVDLVEV